MDIYVEIGKKLKEIRERLDLTQQKVADTADISPHFLSRLESGKEKASLETLVKLSQALNTPD
jgi:transcriptional regulator with XRE-family HTH domain